MLWDFTSVGLEDKQSWLVEMEAHGRAGGGWAGSEDVTPASRPCPLPPPYCLQEVGVTVPTGAVLLAASGVWTRAVLQKFLGLHTGHCMLHPKRGTRIRATQPYPNPWVMLQRDVAPCPSTVDVWAWALRVHGPGCGPRGPPDCRGYA